MAYNLSRMTAYALLSALEEDLRASIKSAIGLKSHADEGFDQILARRAKDRLEKDLGFRFEENELFSLVDYFDLGDSIQTINAHSQAFPVDYQEQIRQASASFSRIISVRNRVMHIRPLNFDDLPLVFDFCESLASKVGHWPELSETLKKIALEPSFVLGLNIPKADIPARVSHNLPLPDFDETGLIGRESTVQQIKNLCLGGFPVISIVGEGGVGKTALALKVAYELLDDERSKFDMVIWVTSKTTQITVNEIREIHGAISSSLGVLREVSSQLTGGTSNSDDANLLEILEYLCTFKIALFIDNLETIMDKTIRDFVGGLPDGSKIIITSRIGLGAYEYPIKLDGIEEKYASQLLRALAKLRNVQSLAKSEEATLRRHVKRMYLNPGYIKWFVSAVQTGVPAETVLQNSALFLEFCMSNVYEYLSKDAREITTTFQCAPGWRDIAELSYLAGFEAIRVQKSLQELMSTNMLAESSKQVGGSVKTTYQLADLARAYLNKNHRPSNAFQQRIKTSRNKLNATVEAQKSIVGSNRYSPFNIRVRVKADAVVAKMLGDALRSISSGLYSEAYVILEESKRLAPDYFEVPRVFAHFHQRSGNFHEARESYELAIALAPGVSQLHLWFGRFILRDEQSVDGAVDQFELAYKLDSESPDILVSLARGYLFQHRFDDVVNMLANLESRLPSMDEMLRRTYYDIKIQIHYRRADDLCTQGDYIGSLSALKMMRMEFESLPPRNKDAYLRAKLAKTEVTLQRLLKHFTDSTNRQQTHDISDWIGRAKQG